MMLLVIDSLQTLLVINKAFNYTELQLIFSQKKISYS